MIVNTNIQIKKNYKKIIYFCIAVTALIYIIFNIVELYQEKKAYEAHISTELYSETNRVLNSLVENNEIYEEVLDKGKVSYYDAYKITQNHKRIADYTQKYQRLAVSFNRIESGETSGETVKNASVINTYFLQQVETLTPENIEDTLFEIDNDTKKKFQHLKALNKAWFQSAEEYVSGVSINENKFIYDSQLFKAVYGEYRVSYDFWVNFVVNLDKVTEDYLATNMQLRDMKSFLWD
ncbi:hypothetical protein LGQ02_11370 [Bacillus shivajii]|uniref:hypothetical protein n=1 Tax=Bacillus shivajii TaxID=1983719 RepID=UPI001CFA437B|nr:hypothetical protein [Bacillus shivajii]UCZ51477.1 hypothetical protein LGQ02_11370 [Bacillus shivajii]